MGGTTRTRHRTLTITTVVTLTGKRIKADVTRNTTVLQLKSSIQDKEGLPPHLQRMIVSENSVWKQLPDGVCLGEYLDKGYNLDSIHLVPRI